MKRFLTIMMALVMIVTLSRCRKPDVETEDNVAKVRISCTIPINKDGKTDFTSDGTVNWSAETERIYLAIPHETNPQIVELTSVAHDGQQPTLTFSGNVTAGSLVTDGDTSYDVWYLGRSQNSKLVYGKVTGSIATQSGKLAELGDHHIAKAKVTASVGDGITLNFNGNFRNQIAIIKLGDESANTSLLRGNAIIGTDYSLQYDEIENKFELAVTESANAKISVVPQAEGESYVVVFPNEETNVELKSDSGKKVTFLNGINAGSMYTVGWEEYEGNNGYEYVDLGLPSGLKWATCNVGANTPEEYGDYFAWGEIETKDEYTNRNCNTLYKEISNISGNPTYDAATAKWGEDWRMPTKMEMQELIDNCTWTWTQLNGVNGYNVIGPNANSIFIPATGTYLNQGHYSANVPYYWTSTPTTAVYLCDAAFILYKGNDGTVKILEATRYFGKTIRPVTGRKIGICEVTTEEVTSRTDNSAVCGGNVTGDSYNLIEKGICWSTSENPTIDDNKKAHENAEGGEYTITLTGLTKATVYYVRAYATNEVGTSYGSQVKFNTTMTGYNGYVYDYDFSNMGSHAVDLGLPSGVMWSDCNIGAEWAVDKVKNEGVWTENIYGNYFMWACIESSHFFGEGNYPDYAKGCFNDENYLSYSYSGDIRYDAATYNFGGIWRTPKLADFEELRDNCYWEYVEIEEDGIEINCVKYTSKINGNSIFFPLGGSCDDEGELSDIGRLARCLTSELYSRRQCTYIGLCDDPNECDFFFAPLWYGFNVRPVIGPIPE